MSTTPPPVPSDDTPPSPSVNSAPPPVPAPESTPSPAPPAVTPPPVEHGAAAAVGQISEKVSTAFKNVNWQQMGSDLKTFGRRAALSDFSKITPESQEMPVVGSYAPRMASLVVWRRAVLVIAWILSAILAVKSCFDPHTFRAQYYESTYEAQVKLLKDQGTTPTGDQLKELKKQVEANTDEVIKNFGESNVSVLNTLSVGLWMCQFASLAILVLAAMNWRNWRKSRKLAMLAVGVVLIPQMVAMLVPWSAMMDFKHLEKQGLGAAELAQIKLMMQGSLVGAVLGSALPFFYGLFNGVLRASLSTKTLIPASIVCGWSTLLLAITISVPWFIILSIVDQFQADALIVIGVICLLAAPLSIVLTARRLGVPLTPEEATPLVRKAKLLLTGLNAAGVLLVLAYLDEKDFVSESQIVTMVIHYFANLMLVQVVAVDMLVLILERAHRKLAADATPDESLRQLGEVLPQN